MTTKRILGMIGGGIVGAAIGWVFAEVLVYQLIEKREERAIFIEVEVDEADEIITSQGYNGEIDPVILNKPERIRANQVKRNEDLKVIKHNYAEIAKQNYPLSDNVIPVDDIEEEVEDDGRISQRVVTEQEWLQTDWESKTLMYYTHDRILTNPDNSIIEFPETLIGQEALDSFGEGTSDPDTVFVCNEDEGMYYEIVREHGSYNEMVLGIPPRSKKKQSVTKNEVVLEQIDEEEHAKRKGHVKRKAKLNASDED